LLTYLCCAKGIVSGYIQVMQVFSGFTLEKHVRMMMYEMYKCSSI
jgi:hypothetical protein